MTQAELITHPSIVSLATSRLSVTIAFADKVDWIVNLVNIAKALFLRITMDGKTGDMAKLVAT